MKILLLSLGLLIGAFSLAHPGHDKVPGAKLAPHGGQLADLKHMHLELVVTGGVVKIYPSDHDGKALAVQDVSLTGEVSYPRGKGKAPVTFIAKDNAFEATIDAKGSHRYTLQVTAQYKDQKDQAQFTVEPQ